MKGLPRPPPSPLLSTLLALRGTHQNMEALFSKVRQRLGSRPRVQLLSDLHLEVGQQYTTFAFPVSAPFLLLAGDIGRLIDYNGYLAFLEAQVASYSKVFLVLGNHEFYGLDYESGVREAQRLAAEPCIASGLVLLHRTRWDDPESNLTVLGCTLWSAIPDSATAVVESVVSDFKKITGWTAGQHTTVHTDEAAWLQEQVAQLRAEGEGGATRRRLLIATHHAPCVEGTARPDQVHNAWSSAFATDLVDQQGWQGVDTWAFGHTHYSAQFTRNGIKLVANQRGYVLPGGVQRSQASRDGRAFDASLAVAV